MDFGMPIMIIVRYSIVYKIDTNLILDLDGIYEKIDIKKM